MNKKNISPLDKKDGQQFLNALGKKIKQFRVEKDWSQERLGFKSNLDRTYIGGIERGERNPSVLNLKKIADALGVTVSELLSKKSNNEE